MITIRRPQDIHRESGEIQDGAFSGRWHFSFGGYHDPEYSGFGALRVFNDDTLTPGAVWPLHPHRDIEVVTYCAAGEFRHADERGAGGVLEKGGVQHTTVGSGMWHSEINNLRDEPMRFIQMWFYPSSGGLRPSVEQAQVKKEDRTNRLLTLVSPVEEDALPIFSDASVFSSFLEAGRDVEYRLEKGHGAYVYVVEGGPIEVNSLKTAEFGAAKAVGEDMLSIKASGDAELLLVDVLLSDGRPA